MAKKKTTEKALNIDNILFNCRDYLRAARNSGSFFEKRDMMLTLVFLRFIGEKYEDGIENLKQTLKEQGLDPEDENIRAAFFDDATFADGTYNLPPEARWSTIISTPAPQLNVALDTALQRLEEEDPQLKGCFVKGTFTARNLAANDIKKIVDEVNKISHKTFGEEKDLIGRVYEYFLKEFAVNATKEEGEFYTPHDVVQLIAMMIEPYDGTLYDPCCGSGGMFIQSAELVKSKQGNLNGINVYGQEKEPATYRLAKMNLALRGISHNLGEEADSSFTHDLHKGLHFNYIMANPPFNLKGWYNDNLKNDGRWSDYQTPPDSNANVRYISECHRCPQLHLELSNRLVDKNEKQKSEKDSGQLSVYYESEIDCHTLIERQKYDLMYISQKQGVYETHDYKKNNIRENLAEELEPLLFENHPTKDAQTVKKVAYYYAGKMIEKYRSTREKKDAMTLLSNWEKIDSRRYGIIINLFEDESPIKQEDKIFVKSIDYIKGMEGEKCLFILTNDLAAHLFNNNTETNKTKNKLYVALTRSLNELSIYILKEVEDKYTKKRIQDFFERYL